MPLARVRVYLDATGPKSVLVNGVDVVDRVAEVGLKASPGQPPELWLMHHGDLDIEGEGVVKLVAEPTSNAGVDEEKAILAFLEAIDAEQLESDALEDLGLGEGNTTVAILEQLKSYARGGA